MSAYDLNMVGRQYSSNIDLALQQRGTKLLETGIMNQFQGDRAEVVKLISSTEAEEVSTRYAPLGDLDPQNSERWMSPRHFQWYTKVDNFDLAELFGNPTSQYVETAYSALKRKIDSVIIDGIFNDNLTGTHGTSTTAFDTTNNRVAVDQEAAAPIGMTVAKLLKSRQILRAYENDLDNEMLFCAISSKQESDLLHEIQVVNTQYSGQAVLQSGRLMSFLGINFIHTERLPTATYRRCPVWVKSGLQIGMWNGISANISVRNDLSSLPNQVYVHTSVGACRSEENKFVEILCSEA